MTPIIPLWFGFTIVGAVLGTRVPESWALDFAIPIAFLAMIAPMFRTLAHVVAALVAVVASLVFVFVPYSLGLIIAGICGYLVLALLWSNIYGILETLSPGGFVHSGGMELNEENGSLIYFSLVTLSTLGYGDISPVTAWTRMISALEAVAGTLYLAVFISSLISRRESTPPQA